MAGNEIGMEFAALCVFWGLITTLILWLIYTIIGNTFNSKSNDSRRKALKTNKSNYGSGEIERKEHKKIHKL